MTTIIDLIDTLLTSKDIIEKDMVQLEAIRNQAVTLEQQSINNTATITSLNNAKIENEATIADLQTFKDGSIALDIRKKDLESRESTIALTEQSRDDAIAHKNEIKEMYLALVTGAIKEVVV